MLLLLLLLLLPRRAVLRLFASILYLNNIAAISIDRSPSTLPRNRTYRQPSTDLAPRFEILRALWKWMSKPRRSTMASYDLQDLWRRSVALAEKSRNLENSSSCVGGGDFPRSTAVLW
jgi:hypothetical protein